MSIRPLFVAGAALLLALPCGSGCAWWKKHTEKREQEAEVRMNDPDFSVGKRSTSIESRGTRPGGWSSEARAIERNLGIQ